VIVMKNCGIVCEYNPFHTGHAYQLGRVRDCGADNIVCVMSGSFVQSAMPAFCDKAIRTECALMGGADAVVELPAVYSTASAQYFAEGGIKVMRNIRDITHIAMGARASASDILSIADIKIKHSDAFRAELKRELDSGKSYNAACTAALAVCYDKYGTGTANVADIMSDPNNMLCVEYIAAIDKLSANIQPLVIERKGAAHGEICSHGEYISATAVRAAANEGRFGEVKRFIPHSYEKILRARAEHSPDMSAYKQIAAFALECATVEYIRDRRNCSEGMEYILKNMPATHDFDRYADAVISKRYGKKRVYRLMLDILLDIDKFATDKRFITRLLGCRNVFDFGLLPNYIITNNAAIKSAAAHDEDVASVLSVDEKATLLYNTICRRDGDYYNYSIVKVNA